MRWIKTPQPASSTTRSYKGGFLLTDIPVSGGQYTKPISGQVLWGLANVASIPGAGNAQLSFEKGGLEFAANCADLTAMDVRVSVSSVAQKLSPNPTVLSIAIHTINGYFGGSAILKDHMPALVTRSMTFYGVISSQQAKGKGYFLLSQLPNSAASPQLSGAVEFKASSN